MLHTWMIHESRHITFEWVVSCISTSHDTNLWVISHHKSQITNEKEVSHIWMGHVTRMSGSCCTYDESRVTRINDSHVAHVNESCHAWAWVMSHMCINHVTHTNQSCHTCESYHTYQRVTSHTHISRVPRMSPSCHTYESCHVYERVTSHIHIRRVPRMSPSCYTGPQALHNICRTSRLFKSIVRVHLDCIMSRTSWYSQEHHDTVKNIMIFQEHHDIVKTSWYSQLKP